MMKRLSGCLKLVGGLVLLVAIVIGGIFAIGRYINSAKSLQQIDGDAASLALIDQTALTNLLDEANRTHSDAIVILKDGKMVGAWDTTGADRQFESMSMTKSIMNLIVGRAYTMGYIESLDEPMSTYFPEWSDPPYDAITLRHVLGHSSGIGRALGPEYMWRSDVVDFGLTSPLLSEPGELFQYSNRTSNLLPAVVEKATGQSPDAFARDHLLHPMGITEFSFQFDRTGNMFGASGFHTRPRDNAKLGQLVLDGGRYEGESLIDEAWFEASLSPSTERSPFFGLSWWLNLDVTFVIDDAHLIWLTEQGASDELIEQLKTIGGEYENGAELESTLFELLGDNAFDLLEDELGASYFVSRMIPAELNYYYADGDLGQQIVGVPRSGIVGVRMYADTLPGMIANYSDNKLNGFPDFARYVQDLAE